MITGILGKKLGMSQIFDDKGTVIPVTLVEAGPCPITHKRTQDKDGYNSIQLGFQAEKKPQRVNKPQKGHFEKKGIAPTRHLREIRLDAPSALEVGGNVTVESFAEGDKVNVNQITGSSSKKPGKSEKIERGSRHGLAKSHFL